MTKTEAAWLAGFLDGEGSFMILKRPGADGQTVYYTPCISAASTDYKLLTHCQEIAAGMIGSEVRAHGNYKAAWIWSIKGLSLASVLKSVIPFLVGKKKQAEILLRLRMEMQAGAKKGEFGVRKYSPETEFRRKIMCFSVKALNHRGTKPIPKEYANALDTLPLI